MLHDTTSYYIHGQGTALLGHEIFFFLLHTLVSQVFSNTSERQKIWLLIIVCLQKRGEKRSNFYFYYIYINETTSVFASAGWPINYTYHPWSQPITRAIYMSKHPQKNNKQSKQALVKLCIKLSQAYWLVSKL